MTEGIIIINKPAGWTSQDVCAKLRNRLHIRKIGHTGTLDPMATGVLTVCTGKSTRIIEYFDRDRKSYHAVMRLGITTDTLDITGGVTGGRNVRIGGQASDEALVITEKDIYDAFSDYTGEISQLPPKYSAIRISGRRAYDLARSGADFEMKSRKITIYENKITCIDPEKCEIEFDVTCSKGTYIRSICDDIGRTLGCGAVMTALSRTASGCFRIEDAAGVEELCEMSDEEIEQRIIPVYPGAAGYGEDAGRAAGYRRPAGSVDETLMMLGRVLLDNKRVMAFTSGNSSWLRSCRITEKTQFDDLYRVYTKIEPEAGLRFLGIARIEGDSLVPVKVMV